MKNIFSLFSFFLVFSCVKKKEKSIPKDAILIKDSNENKIPLSENTIIDSTKIINIGYQDTIEKLPKLTFTEISKDEFNAVKPKEQNSEYEPKADKDFLYITTKISKHRFKKYRDYGGDKGHEGFEFRKFYPSLNIYALTENSTSESLGFGELFLMDGSTDYKYNIISFGDGSVETPIASPNNKYLVYYYNSVYENKNCDIGLLKINEKTIPAKYLTEFASHHSDIFAVEKLVWKSDQSFLIKGYEEVYENEKWVKHFKYYKTEF